jgi:ABC-type Mn2+/Zn2+ transport system ATPase subunit
MLGFQDVSVGTLETQLLSGITGYVACVQSIITAVLHLPALDIWLHHRFVLQGGVTAVLGPSASGKSLLLKLLSGRLPHLQKQGDIILHHRVNDLTSPQGLGFAPQEDLLIGDLTVRYDQLVHGFVHLLILIQLSCLRPTERSWRHPAICASTGLGARMQRHRRLSSTSLD